MFACFVGVVGTTLAFASLGLVAVASGAGTTAAAGTLIWLIMSLCILMQSSGVNVRPKRHWHQTVRMSSCQPSDNNVDLPACGVV